MAGFRSRGVNEGATLSPTPACVTSLTDTTWVQCPPMKLLTALTVTAITVLVPASLAAADTTGGVAIRYYGGGCTDGTRADISVGLFNSSDSPVAYQVYGNGKPQGGVVEAGADTSTTFAPGPDAFDVVVRMANVMVYGQVQQSWPACEQPPTVVEPPPPTEPATSSTVVEPTTTTPTIAETVTTEPVPEATTKAVVAKRQPTTTAPPTTSTTSTTVAPGPRISTLSYVLGYVNQFLTQLTA